MKISELILYLNKLRKEHGDVEVLGNAPHYEQLYPVDEESISYVVPSEYMHVDSPSILIHPK